MTAEDLIKVVGAEFGFGPGELCTPALDQRGPKNVALQDAKRAAQYLVRQNTMLGWKGIAALFRCSYHNSRVKVGLAMRQLRRDEAFALLVRRIEERHGLKKTVDDVLAMDESELPPDVSTGSSKTMDRAVVSGARVYQRGDA